MVEGLQRPGKVSAPWRSLTLALAFAASCAAATGGYELLRPGHYRCYYTSAVDGTEQPYHIYVPRCYNPDRPAPVVFALHGFGGRTWSSEGDVWRENWADSEGWLLVNLDGRGSQNWDGVGEDDIFCVLDDLRSITPYHAALNVDLRRLYLEGCSMGGHGAFREGFRYPDRFAAVAPAAGWTTYKEFYSHFYDAAEGPRLPDHVDPSRRPVLETASSLWQAGNTRWTWIYVTYDRNDEVNPPKNAEEVVGQLRAAGSDRYATRVGERGHCGSYCACNNYHFLWGKTTKDSPPDVVYSTNNLRYNSAYWLSLDRLRLMNQWARIAVHVSGGSLTIHTDNVLQFTVDFARSPIQPGRKVAVKIDRFGPLVGTARPTLTFAARLNEGNETCGWSVLPPTETAEGRVRKTAQLFGPIADAFRSHFIVVYGTRHGVLEADLRNGDWVGAQRFATEWNNWMSLHWPGLKPPANRALDWWVPPYPFPNGHSILEGQPLVTPLPDTQFGLGNLPDANLILFGDPDSNWLIAQAVSKLPLELTTGQDGPQVRVRERLYAGPFVNYFFIAPSPFAEGHYVVVARGYLSSQIDPSQHTAWNVGKDLEALPFYWPDYVVWDARKEPARTVQPPLKYLPETYLDAGYFGEDWKLDETPPVTTVRLKGKQLGKGVYRRPVRVELTAQDNPGGFGVRGIEYCLNGGPWRTYSAPFDVVLVGKVSLTVRATDVCGQYVYDPKRTPNRGVEAQGNAEAARTVRFELR